VTFADLNRRVSRLEGPRAEPVDEERSRAELDELIVMFERAYGVEETAELVERILARARHRRPGTLRDALSHAYATSSTP